MSSISRRTILQAAATIGLVPKVVTPGSIKAAALAEGVDLSGMNRIEEPSISTFSHRLDEILNYNASIPRMETAPLYISTPRSWSQAFRNHLHLQHLNEMRVLSNLLYREKDLADRVAARLGLDKTW